MKRMGIIALALATFGVLACSTDAGEGPLQRLYARRAPQQPGSPPPVPVEPMPVAPEQMRYQPAPLVPPGAGPVVVQAMYHRDFAKAFTPMAGTHRVMLVHPYTCCPVEVCFTLPCGCPKVKCSRNEIEFDYGKKEVEIRFYRCGDVKVKYRDGCCLFDCLR